MERKKRKTIGIYILDDGTVLVRAPQYVTKSKIDAFVQRQALWILKKSAIAKARTTQRASFAFAVGTHVYIKGKAFEIRTTPQEKAFFDGQYFYINETHTQQKIRSDLIEIYQSLAGAYIPPLVAHYQTIVGVTPMQVKVSGAKKRWGSCSSKGRLNFSWRLLMADERAIAYVVVHELAHLKQLNHSKQFWQVVERVLPDYKNSKRLLKETHERMVQQGFL